MEFGHSERNRQTLLSLATLSAIGKSMEFGHSECNRQTLWSLATLSAIGKLYGVLPLRVQ